VVV
jgi:hypothetical protein